MNELFLILCVNLLLQHVGSEQLVNIALGKTPTQDDILNYPEQGHPWIVSNSVDGRTDCGVVDEHHYSGTAERDHPWWQLDLGYIYKIHAIHVLGRRETDPDQLAGFALSAGVAEGNLQLVYRNNDTVYNAGDIWINTTMAARIIRIDLPNDEVTHRKNGGTLALCEVEVYVPFGDIIKHSSNATQSSEYSGYGGHFAIDGIYPTSDNKKPETCHCCSVTYGSDRPWWSVNFGKPQMIGEVIITGRMDDFNAYQSKDLSIFISNRIPSYASGMFGELVWTLTNSTQGYVFPYTFDPPRLFQYMSIARPNHGSPYMTICEVDLITAACTLGRFGDRCSRKCHCSDSRPCSQVTGVCQSPGCMTGWKGHNCECQSDHYGFNCSQTCGRCASGSCNIRDGTCPDGCAPNYDTRDKMCKTCSFGYYGFNCSQTCGHCIGGRTTCSVINGTCFDGCAPGYTFSDRKCQSECRTGLYGSNCSQTCGRCASGSCNIRDGTCPDGCAPNYDTRDKKCTTCSSGYYGSNCSQTCGHCIGGITTCLVINGTCTDGCAPGYTFSDSSCQTECQSGLYGSNCSHTCGHCIGGKTTCLVINGTCTDGCAPGYTFSDSSCQTECQPGHYGLNCLQRCGHCFEDTHTCNKTDGSCPAGCAAGYNHTADNKCNKVCDHGYYGINCSNTCGHCIDGNSNCTVTQGECPNGCSPGYDHTTDKTCKTNCPDRRYGASCQEVCGNCNETSTCLPNDGTCVAGCAPGFDFAANMTCKQVCQDGKFGQNCSETCGKCSGGSIQCSKIDGVCLLQCDDGYKGAKCQDSQDSQDTTSDVTTIFGAVVPVIVIVISVVILVVVLKRRRRLAKRKIQRTNGQATSEFVNLETLVRERETQRKTAGKANTSDEKPQSNENGGYYSFNPGDHVTNSINIRDLWDYITKNRANNFDDLFVEFHAVPGGLQFECYAAQRDENVGKNKYRNMYPYDHCRVKLKVPEGQTDYINASHVDGYERVQKFIAAQGPQKGTIEDFWLMVWQQGARKVVMLTNVFEMGKDKCEQYWPNEGASIQYGGIEVTSKGTTEKCDYSIRKFELRMEHEKTRRVDQFHFKSWPDKDVPDSTWCLVNFWRVAMNKDHGKSPIVVHCSAGIGRTGTFIALDALYHQAMAEGGIRPVSVIETLRRQRINMVQTKYQYAFLHEALADALLVGTHFFWASQLPSVCNFFRGRNPEATVTRAHEQFKLICECIASSKEQQKASTSAAAENIYEETGEPMVEPEYGNISTVQSEISEYRPRTKDRNSASIQQMNAIYLPNYAEASTYILAETPCDSSLPDLWTLVEEQNVTTIVNLTETMHPYFQTSCTLGANGEKPVGRFVVNVVKEVKHKEYTIRSIVYKEQDKETNAGFTVKMFSLSAWQQGAECPDDLNPLIALLEEVNKWHPYVSEAKPVLFICGDGRTRCGLVAAILNESQRMRNEEGHVNIVETVMMMKKRAGDVISAEQFQFLYEAVFAYALRMGYALDTGDYNNA